MIPIESALQPVIILGMPLLAVFVICLFVMFVKYISR